jgi:hypothetical protein
LRELDGAVALLAAAQAAEGDDRLTLLDLAADAWAAARKFGGFGAYAVDGRVAEFEIERMAAAEIGPECYVEMLRVYLQKGLADVREALRQLEAMP